MRRPERKRLFQRMGACFLGMAGETLTHASCFAALMIGRMAAVGAAPFLSVRNLTVTFPPAAGEEARVVDGVSFDVAPGEIVALVGESGCGKSLTGLSLIDLVPEPGRVASGDILFEG